MDTMLDKDALLVETPLCWVYKAEFSSHLMKGSSNKLDELIAWTIGTKSGLIWFDVLDEDQANGWADHYVSRWLQRHGHKQSTWHSKVNKAMTKINNSKTHQQLMNEATTSIGSIVLGPMFTEAA